jgi:hypothetical protein
MGVNLIRPRVNNLVFQVFGRPLHPELFDLLAVHKVKREDYTLIVRLTRTGHVISWNSPDVFLTEVAAAGDDPLPKGRRLRFWRLRGEGSDTLVCPRHITYQTAFQVEVLPSEIFLNVHDEILADGRKRGLLYHFQPNHRLSLSPLSLITVEARPGCLFLATFHTFPDDNAVVKTQSLIEKKKHS